MDTKLNKELGIVCCQGGKTTPYFKLERGTRKGDPISAYVFILALEVVFSLIKANPDIKGLQFFSHTFLYSAYADDTRGVAKIIIDPFKILRKILTMMSSL